MVHVIIMIALRQPNAPILKIIFGPADLGSVWSPQKGRKFQLIQKCIFLFFDPITGFLILDGIGY